MDYVTFWMNPFDDPTPVNPKNYKLPSNNLTFKGIPICDFTEEKVPEDFLDQIEEMFMREYAEDMFAWLFKERSGS